MSITIQLSDNKANVLFDFLFRAINDKNGETLAAAIEHEGELWALNGLLGHLEETLTLPFDPDYAQGLAKAREALVTHSGSWPDSDH